MRGISEIPLLSLMLGDPECAARGDREPRLQDIQRRQQVGSVVRRNTGADRQSCPLFEPFLRQFNIQRQRILRKEILTLFSFSLVDLFWERAISPENQWRLNGLKNCLKKWASLSDHVCRQLYEKRGFDGEKLWFNENISVLQEFLPSQTMINFEPE